MRIIVLLVLGCIISLNAGAQDIAKKHIVVIGVDGLSSFGLKKAATPVLDSLRKNGSYSLTARAVTPTLSSPNWASMLMGVKPHEHQIFHNQWRRNHFENKTFCGGPKGNTYPTIFRQLKSDDDSAKIVVIHHWKEFSAFVEPGVAAVLEHASSEDSVAGLAIHYMLQERPALMFVHFDHVDKAGHTYGHKSRQYNEAVERTDSLIGEMVRFITNSPMRDNVVFLITSDHGFWGKHHGGKSRKEIFIPWIMAGSGIKKDHKIKAKVQTYDTAVTLAYMLNVKSPACWKGKAVKEVFE